MLIHQEKWSHALNYYPNRQNCISMWIKVHAYDHMVLNHAGKMSHDCEYVCVCVFRYEPGDDCWRDQACKSELNWVKD